METRKNKSNFYCFLSMSFKGKYFVKIRQFGKYCYRRWGRCLHGGFFKAKSWIIFLVERNPTTLHCQSTRPLVPSLFTSVQNPYFWGCLSGPPFKKIYIWKFFIFLKRFLILYFDDESAIVQNNWKCCVFCKPHFCNTFKFLRNFKLAQI